MTEYKIEVEYFDDDTADEREDTMWTSDEDEAERIYQELTEDPTTRSARLSYTKTSGGIAYNGGILKTWERSTNRPQDLGTPKAQIKYPYSDTAKIFIEAVKTIAEKPENLENLEAYLSIHFSKWLLQYANTPEKLAGEMKAFAEMDI